MKKSQAYIIIFGGVLIVSFGALIVKSAQKQNVPSLSIAAGRLVFAALIITLPTLIRKRHELKQLKRTELASAGVAGIFLAIHFATWVSSMAYTSVASSAALVSTTPIWVALFSFFILKEKKKIVFFVSFKSKKEIFLRIEVHPYM